MKRFLASVVFLFITISSFSQVLNNYKYVIIPYEFDFLDKHDQYRVNTLVRHLFNEEGFEVLYDSEEFPGDLASDRCSALYVDINDGSSLFTIKASIVLRDCSNQVVMETSQGRSKIKAYQKGYNEALRIAFKDIKAKKYTYIPKAVVAEVKPITKVVEMPEKVVETATVKVKEAQAVVKQTQAIVEKTEVAVQKETVKTMTAAETVLYAQPIKNGFQLVDSTPKVVMILLKTGAPNVYIVKGQDASVYQENGKWVLSKVTDNGTEVSVLNVKF